MVMLCRQQNSASIVLDQHDVTELISNWELQLVNTICIVEGMLFGMWVCCTNAFIYV